MKKKEKAFPHFRAPLHSPRSAIHAKKKKKAWVAVLCRTYSSRPTERKEKKEKKEREGEKSGA